MKNWCPICWNDIKIFGVGCCNHIICYKCVIKIRISNLENDCAICNQDLPNIILTERRQKYEDIMYNKMDFESEYQIFFENQTIKGHYQKVLQKENQNLAEINDLNDAKFPKHNNIAAKLLANKLAISLSQNIKYYSML